MSINRSKSMGSNLNHLPSTDEVEVDVEMTRQDILSNRHEIREKRRASLSKGDQNNSALSKSKSMR